MPAKVTLLDQSTPRCTDKTTTTSSERTNHKPQKTMKPKIATILEKAIDEGIHYGWHRAHKHTDTPDSHFIKGEIDNAIWNAIHEVFEFGEEETYVLR